MASAYGLSQMKKELSRGELSDHDEEQESLWSTITSLVDALRAKLTDSITSALSSVLNFLDGYVPAISAIVSAVITLLVSIITLAVQYNSTTVKVALGVGILAALTSFISNVAILFKPLGSWHCDKAQAAAVELASRISTTIAHEGEIVANSLDFKTWITVGITSLVSVLFAGLGLSGAVTWRDLVTSGNLLESIRKTQNNVTNVADFILRDVVGLELDKDYPQCCALEDLANRGAKLQQCAIVDFVQKPELLFQLKKYVSEVVNTTSKRMSMDSSRRYMTVRQLLVEIYRQLSQKLDAVNAILATKPRQVTVGLMLSGDPGHGKSEFGKYICKRVANALGYPEAVYCLNKKADGFYEPYGGNAIGVYNEFMALRSEDGILRDLNLILSSDPMNFEAANIEGKTQPCQLKIVFLTSNSHNPQTIRVLSEGAVAAMWDRIYHIGVDDPKCRGRQQPNDHRKPDFSHLNFTLIKHNSLESFTESPITLKDIEERLIGRCAMAERAYIREVLSSEPDEPIASALMDRSRLLGDMLIRCNPYDVLPNSLGREFFITRFQGLPGSGKSTLAEQVAKECSSLFCYDIQYSRCNEEFHPSGVPMIYVLDDWVEEHNIHDYVQKMNQTHDRSIFFITSNHVFQRVPFWRDPFGAAVRSIGSLGGFTTACPWDATTYNSPPGSLRRLGLQGFIRVQGGATIQTPEVFQKTYNFGENFLLYDAYGRVGNRSEVLETIFKSYRLYLSRPTEYVLINGIPPVMKDPAVTLEAPDALSLITGLRSTKKCMDAYLGRADGFKLIIAPRLRGPTASSQTMVSAWLVVEQPSNDQAVLHSVWSRMCATFGRTFPGESLLLRLTNTDTVYYYENGVAYTYGPEALQNSIPVEIQDSQLIYHRDSHTPIVVTSEQFAAARLYNQFDGPMTTCTAAEYRAINRAFVAELASARNPQFVTSYLIEEQRAHSKFSTKSLWLKSSLKAHPIFWIGASLLSLVCVGGVFYSFIKLAGAIHYYFTQKSDPVLENSSSPKDSKGFNPARTALRRMTTFTNSDSPGTSKGHNPARRVLSKITTHRNSILPDGARPNEPAVIIDFLNQLKRVGTSAEWALKDLLYSNPHYEDLVYRHPYITDIYDNLQHLESEIEEVHSNMLRSSDMIQQPPTELEQLHTTIRKSYVHVTSSDGSCYGIHLQNGLILTVSHLFSDIGECVTIRNDGTEYKARVVSLYRERDLAVVKVLDSKFPSLPTTKRFFMPFEDMVKPKYGFFMRCGPDLQLMGGLINYYATTTAPITSDGNSNYKLSERLIVHIATALNQTRSFIKGGDCGFPLIGSTGSQFRILALHNGYNLTQKSYYSSFSLEDYNAFVSDATIVANSDDKIVPLHLYELTDVDHQGLLPLPYGEALEDLRESELYGHYSDTLHILGYSDELALRSRPKDQHHPIEVPNMITKPLTLPAAYTMDRVTDSSSLAITNKGHPSPLFTQCLKYDKRALPTYSPQILDEACGLVMQDSVSRYGGCRFLRLHETLNGIQGRSLPPIDTRTSAGPLLKLVYKIHNKRPVLNTVKTSNGRETLVFADTPAANMVRDHFTQYKAALLEDNIPPILFSKDCAKVELIDADKAAQGKVRLFNEVDFSINLLFRSLFGDFASRVMENHLDSPIRMGMNPYLASTAIQRSFNEIDGNLVSTDFSSFDKQLPLELIQAFCWIVSRCMTGTHLPQQDREDIYFAIARSLIYVIHSCKGTIYLVDRGNESGTFVTTLLNSISVDVLTTYTLIRRWQIIFNFTPSLAELSSHCRKAILGDDRSLKVSSQLDIQQEDLIEDSKLFCLKCTPAKTDSGLDFCSRALYWDEQWQISWPALKVASVTSQLHWTTSYSDHQLLENCDNAIYEAALHPNPDLFQDVLSDSLSILRAYGVPFESLKFHSRDLIRRRFIGMVKGTPDMSDIQRHIAQVHDENPIEYVSKSKRVYDVLKILNDDRLAEKQQNYTFLRESLSKFDLSELTTDPSSNPVGFLLEILHCKQLQTRVREEYEFNNNNWLCTLFLFGDSASACGSSKKIAKALAYRVYLDKLYGGILSSDTRRVEQKIYYNSAENISTTAPLHSNLITTKRSYINYPCDQITPQDRSISLPNEFFGRGWLAEPISDQKSHQQSPRTYSGAVRCQK
uniref:Putative polyprotein n=1 Tax=HVAC-associated RNA virus 1 TaxID=2083425 RepID=A0A2L1GHI9_9VIRU|nr:putative polyprotein [HVAC-associated RNA virus 1]